MTSGQHELQQRRRHLRHPRRQGAGLRVPCAGEIKIKHYLARTADIFVKLNEVLFYIINLFVEVAEKVTFT